MTAPVIQRFSDHSPSDLFELFKDVYASSEGMSELLEDKYPDLEDFKRDMADLQSLPGAVALTADLDGKAAAYLIIRPRKQARLRHTADLNIGVGKAARRKGLGKLLLQAGLEQVLASSVLEIIYLMARADNRPAIQLYERMGFTALATLSRDIKVGTTYFDGILMRRFMDG